MASLAERLSVLHRKAGRWTIAGLPEGADSLALAEIATTTGGQDILHVARDGQRLERLQDGLRFFAPEREVLVFPAWDCLPYDRLSPHPDIVAERLQTLARLATPKKPGAPSRIVLASVGAALQKVPPRSLYADAATILRKGQTLEVTELTAYLGSNGYGRADTVMEPGEFAIRGGLIDLYPPGTTEPFRLDWFGDTIESIRSFDPMTQLSTGDRDEIVLLPVSEVLLTPQSIERFRGGYRALFGNVAGEDLLYEAVSAGQRHVGMEHWLPLFHDRLETLLDYCPDAIVTADHQIAEAFESRYELIADYYDARLKTGAKGGMSGGADYKPIPPEQLYLKPSQWNHLLDGRSVGLFTSFDAAPDAPDTIDLGGRRHEGFAQARTAQGVNLFDKVAEHLKAANDAGRKVVIAGFTEGSAPAASPAGTWCDDAGARAGLRDGSKSARRRAGRRGLAARSRLRPRRTRNHRRGRHSGRPAIAAAEEAPPVRALHRRSRGTERRRPGGAPRARRGALRRPGDPGNPLCAARLPAAHLRRRRQALRAGGEHRRAQSLWRGGRGCRSRPAGWRRVAVAQSQAEAAHRRHGRPADQDRRRKSDPARRGDEPAGGRLRRVLRARPTTSCRRSPTSSTTWPLASRWTGWSAATWASARPRLRSVPPLWPQCPASRWR